MSNEALVLMIRDRHIEVPISSEEFRSLYGAVLSGIHFFSEQDCKPPQELLDLGDKFHSLYVRIWEQDVSEEP